MSKNEFINKMDSKEKGCDYSLHRISRFIQPSLLLFLSKSSSYGYQLIENLRSLGFHRESIDVGAVYRSLRKMEKEGLVKSLWEKSEVRRRKRYYKITPSGRKLLKIWLRRIEERKQALEKFIFVYKGGKL